MVKRYLAMYDALVVATGDVPLEADIPFWFDEVPGGRTTLDREVLRRVDGVAVMAYRNRADGASTGRSRSAPTRSRRGRALGKPVRIGQETNDLGPDPTARKQTFHGFHAGRHGGRAGARHRRLRRFPGFAGLAIHDSVGWAAVTG